MSWLQTVGGALDMIISPLEGHQAFSTRFAARAKAFGASEELEAEADSKTCRQDQQRTKKKRTRNEKKQQLLHQKLEQLAAQQAEEEEEEPQTLLGLQEPLDKEGYRRAADLVDPEAMVVFLRRLLDSQGGKSLDDSDLLQFACRCSVEDKGFGEVMLLLGLESWTSDTSGAAGAELQLPPELELPPPPPAGLPEGAGPTMFQVEGVAVPAPSGAATLVAELPLEPRSGSVDGGTRLQWTGQGPAPLDLYLAGRPCAALRGGAFVVPLLREQEQERGSSSSAAAVDVLAVFEDSSSHWAAAFTYWAPGQLNDVSPRRGPPQGGLRVRVETTDLGAPISEVLISGEACDLKPGATSTEAFLKLPVATAEGDVAIEVRAPNGNGATANAAFTYLRPEAFGRAGHKVALSQDGQVVTRRDGVNDGVCIGALPLRRQPAGGRYFELSVGQVGHGGQRALAMGVVALKPESAFLSGGRAMPQEAREFERAWLAGYDRGGALFLADGRESKIPTGLWRPAASVKAGTVFGVLWTDAAPGNESELVIFQDGKECVRLPAGVGSPGPDEELFAVVDLQGSARQVSLVVGAIPPADPHASLSAERLPMDSSTTFKSEA